METEGHNIFEGRLVRLRGIEPEDWETLHAWNQDLEASRTGYWVHFPGSKERQRQWALQRSQQDGADDDYFFVIETLAGEIVGSLNTTQCDRRNGTFTYGIYIARAYWRRGYASEAIRLVLRYFFRELRYQKVTTRVYSFNTPSLALHDRLGFVREGVMRRMRYTGGQYHDEVIFGMTAEEFAATQAAALPNTC